MRFLDIVAAPHPAGRIDLRWRHPNLTQFPGMRLVRREGTHPLSPTPTPPQQGVVVADTNPTASQKPILVQADGRCSVADDINLKGENVYYYTLFPYAGNPPNYETLDHRHNRVAAMATSPYNIAGQMADLLPTLYHRYDTAVINDARVAPADRDKGQLRRFLDLPGSQLDLLYSFARAMRDLHDLNKVDSRLLALLAQWIGWRIDQRIESDTQRNNIRNAPHLYKSIGLIPTVEATVKRLVGWKSRTKEFVHNVFRSNQPERLNLWMRTQDSAGAWSTKPLSLDFAYEGRPAAFRDQGGTLWLFYHTLRKGRWDIWFKTIRDGQDWTPSEPLTNRALIDKYPTAARQGTTLRVFWSTYNEADQRWQLNVRTRANNQWLSVTRFSELAPFANNDIQRRQPWAVTDNSGLLWLFWLELVGQQWQLRYNRYDGGTTWALPVAPATFPLDAGADPRVEGAPFVVFNPTDTAQPLWVFWARTEAIGTSGQRRWRIVYRVKASLNPTTLDWSVVRALLPGPAESQDREPAALVKTNGDVELFWSSTRNGSWSIWRATVNRATHAWGTAEMLINSPYTQCDPLPISTAAGTMLVYRANESVMYTSSVYDATETVDMRYAGSTTIDVRNTAKHALRKKFGDFQTYTSDVGKNGVRTNENRYARETVGLYVTPDTTDPAMIQRNQTLLRNALREFLPASVRTVFVKE
jgi:hypothetical protein